MMDEKYIAGQPLSVDEVLAARELYQGDTVSRIDAWLKWPMRIVVGGAALLIAYSLVDAYFRGVLHP